MKLAVLGGLAKVERDLIRTRTAEGRSHTKAKESNGPTPFPLTGTEVQEAIRAARAGRNAGTSAGQFRGEPRDDFTARNWPVPYLLQ